jgi:acetylornithine/LysW-gamma-L-lysine aminotransferase
VSRAPESPVLARGEGSHVHTQDGRALVDLAMGFGAVFLGHTHPAVTRALQEQAAQLLHSGRNPTPGTARVGALLAALLPAGLRPAGVYSTGMEVAEFAMRIAATHTGRDEFAGFEQSMHGKSAMTAALSWRNAPLRPANAHVLPFVAQAGEAAILDALASLLGTRRVAALFVEPVQGSNAAHQASPDFYRRAIDLCRESGTLCIFDETLTGLHRTGPAFYVELLQKLPDMLLFAKCLGNGFPVSAIALGEPLQVRSEALPGSTFSGNPMALAAAEATLTAMASLPMAGSVAAIEKIVRSTLGDLHAAGAVLRGRGALWCLEFGDKDRLDRTHVAIREAGLLVMRTERFIRLLPAATIEPRLLQESCEKIAHACSAA